MAAQRPPSFSSQHRSPRVEGFGSRNSPSGFSKGGGSNLKANFIMCLQLFGIFIALRIVMLSMGMPFFNIPYIDPLVYKLVHILNGFFARMG